MVPVAPAVTRLLKAPVMYTMAPLWALRENFLGLYNGEHGGCAEEDREEGLEGRN